MSGGGYKKYMKKGTPVRDYSLIKIFVLSFFGMLLVFTILIKSFAPSTDTSIGDYKQDTANDEMVNVDGRLAAIQEEDTGRSFSDLMKKADDVQEEDNSKPDVQAQSSATSEPAYEEVKLQTQEPIYKVYVGSYTSAEQAKVAKEIITESAANLNPIVKCIGSNNYTLQVGIFKSKSGADSMLSVVQQNHLPGRVVQEY